MGREALAERILQFVQAEGYQPQQLAQLARALGIAQDEQGDFHDTCRALMRTGRVVLGSGNGLLLPSVPGKIYGTFRANRRGFGFVVPDGPETHGDLYIPPDATGGALTGDFVSARVKKRGKRQGRMLLEGRVTRIIQRGQSRFVGELRQQLKRWMVIPDGRTLHVPIFVDDPGAKNARGGDQVVVEIVQYPEGMEDARGVIVKVLGPRGSPDVDALTVIEQFQLPAEFPDHVLTEAHASATSFDLDEELARREDLRSLTTITIDPVDARDFDDAISLTENPNGTRELGVHIADVSHFVPEGGNVDLEARERSTSVYLPGMVIPMLPEVLSNGVCSLQEHQPRLTKSVFITYDEDGEVVRSRLSNTIIRSSKRLSYEEASAMLASRKGSSGGKVGALLARMESLARAIQERRVENGMLELNLPEAELVFNDEGEVIDAVPADQSYSHKIIEMFMVEANEAVARTLTGHDVPFLRRVHGEPGSMADEGLRRMLSVFELELPRRFDRADLQRILKEVQDKPESFAINFAILRSMQQAEYAPEAIGHYALASSDYCHFTSPIRRYPDLAVHRLVQRHVDRSLDEHRRRGTIPSMGDCKELGEQCSAHERRAESAERELKHIFLLRLLEKHVGEEFSGIVTGVTSVGVFVQLERYLIDGLLRFEHLPDDWWELDSAHGMIVGQRSGRRIVIGDRLKVTVVRTDLAMRELELGLGQSLPRATSKSSPAARKKKDRAPQGRAGNGRNKKRLSSPQRKSRRGR